ncbi:iron ABC transporter permease [Pontibaca sp. S1109L]|uniref:Iron ABC transporter permease n=1 Tax=Pontibaca salina TaxID=2795731 RepID=A0A934HL39_9RHOB|nr:iron ABC transporter permease [Pontibaca salina]
MGVVLCLLSITLSVSIGSTKIPVRTVWSIVLHKLSLTSVSPDWGLGRENIVWNLRLPRALLAALVGAGLGVAGGVMQSVTRNPLADPHLLGVSAGAGFGANLAILLVGNLLGVLTVPLFAFAGALAATFVVVLVAGFSASIGPTRLVLAGLAVSFVIAAGSNVLIMLADPRAISSVVFWMLGSFGFAQWNNLLIPAVALLFSLIVFFRYSQQLNALAMGDESAATLGINVRRLRVLILTVSALLTGVLVAFSGMIGFVGLMMPHIARLLIGGDNGRVLPASALLGAIFLVLSDVAARRLTAPNDMPIGVVTGLIGGLFFIALLTRYRE